MEQAIGTLYLCATPIGNLEDVTLRVLRVLREADSVWAEDTRRTLGLLNHYGIKKPLVSCHEHNEKERAAELVGELRRGKSIAFCSDAGMPGISDPGTALLAACAAEGLPVTVLPGASAVPAAAVLSGLYAEPFTFYGFLPREKKPRAAMLHRLKTREGLLLLYESPVRLPATLKDLLAALGDRPAAVLRELTKVHEEAARGTLSSLCERFPEPPRGECVITIQGVEQKKEADVSEAALDEAIVRLLKEGFSARDAASAAAAILQTPKKLAYARTLQLSKEE
ncbi:MAG TPA: 16S rRNA (cytidine(1402)-2'-O)-methyltransferase [Feifaniaceae bacterium]|nr:16S rRNA (cytidine(1402)-2'-O)-methyltransferase [Feifaniaceae bacterium]